MPLNGGLVPKSALRSSGFFCRYSVQCTLSKNRVAIRETQDARMRSTRPAAVIAIIVRKFALIARPTSVGPVVSNGCNRQDDIGQFPLPRRVVLFVSTSTA
jgi:hypothetical protein